MKEGKYREALVKWEAAITLVPEKAILHEQKAQVLLELGEAWNALKAATRASSFTPLHIYALFLCSIINQSLFHHINIWHPL